VVGVDYCTIIASPMISVCAWRAMSASTCQFRRSPPGQHRVQDLRGVPSEVAAAKQNLGQEVKVHMHEAGQ
jgi:hypothetical protein